ncbi:MAG: hypothetical protein MZV65_01225 [Chromatiales bacterium]|nr:hypothetical protein [Chromatiales bacterium]
MPETATLQVQGKTYSLPVVVGTENEVAVDISEAAGRIGSHHARRRLRQHRLVPESAITFIDGEKGILRYRGIPIEELAEHSPPSSETAYLLIYGELPTSRASCSASATC